MRGSIEKRGKYSWRLTVNNGTGLGGKRDKHHKTIRIEIDDEAKARRMAEKELEKFADEIESGRASNAGKMKFRQFRQYWKEKYLEKNCKMKTIESYSSELDNRIGPAFDHMPIQDIRPKHLIDFYDNLQEDGIRMDGRKGGLSNNTINYYHRILSSMLRDAVEWGFINENPADRVKPPKKNKKEARFYDRDQALKFVAALDTLKPFDFDFKVAFLLDFITGARRGEILGLEWPDIDFEQRTIFIQRTSQYIKGKGIVTDTPKNKTSIRKVKIPSFVIELLKEYKKWQNKRRLKIGDKWTQKIKGIDGKEVPNNRLFTQWNGVPMYPSTLSHRFKEFIEANGLDPLNFHGGRHTAITQLIEEGLNYKAAGSWGGHAQGQTTINIYAHTTKSADEKAAEIIESIYAPKKEVKRKKYRVRRSV